MNIIGDVIILFFIIVFYLILRKTMKSQQDQVAAMQEKILEDNVHRIDALEKKIDGIIAKVDSLSEDESIHDQNQSELMKQLQENQSEMESMQEAEAKKIQYGFRSVNNYCKEIKENSKMISDTIFQNFGSLHSFHKEHKKSSKNIEELVRLLLINSLIDDAESAMEIYREENVK